MRKILSIFLAFTMIFCILPLSALAEGTEDISSYFGFTSWGNGYLVTSCNKAISGDITIPSEFRGKPVLAIKGGAFDRCDSLTSVTIPDTVTEIYESIPFRTCAALTTINIPASLTKTDGRIASHCTALTEINVDSDNPLFCSIDGVLFDKNVTKLLFYPGRKPDLSYTIPDTVVTIGSRSFSDSDVLKELTIPDSVTTIEDYAFYDAYAPIERAIEKITFGSGIKTIGNDAFWSCDKITQVNITDIEAWCNVDFAGDSSNPMWDDAISSQVPKTLCYNGEPVVDLVIPDTVTEIKPWAFTNCLSIETVKIPDSVKSIGDYVFRGCRSIKEIDIPSSVTSIGGAFYNCYGLEKVNIPSIEAWCNISFSSETANPLYYADGLYVDGVAVTEITIPNTITSIKDYAFNRISSLTAVTIPSSVTSIGKNAFARTSITEITVPDSVTSIGESAFEYCTALKTADISDNVTSISSKLFNNCNVLESLTLSERLTSIGVSAFGSTAITSFVIPDTVTSMGTSVFSNCKSLKSITIPEGITSIPGYTFSNCSSLNNVTIPSTVTSIGSYAFTSTAIKEITIPEGVTTISTYTFYRCSMLKNVIIPSSVTTIESYAFAFSGLTDITIPETITKLASNSYRGCTAAKTLTIPNSITTIPNSAFYLCNSLEEVIIPDSITSIEAEAFSNCVSLKSVTIPSSVKSIKKTAFGICRSMENIYINDLSAWISTDIENEYSAPLYEAKDGKIYLNNQLLTDLEIPQGSENIKKYIFENCDSIKNVFVPKSVTVFDQNAFYNCDGIKYVFYEGTAEEWSAINFTTGNEALTNAIIIFNSRGIPAEIVITKLPEKTEYIEKTEELDLAGGVITIYYKNGEAEEIDLNTLTVTGFDNTVLGEQILTVEYYGLTTEFMVNIIPRPTTLIAITKLPNKLKYNFGEVIDLTGGEIVVCYPDGTFETKEITADMISGLDLCPGFKTLTVNYNGKQTQFSIMMYRNPDLDHNGMVSATDIAILRKSVLVSDDEEDYDLNVDGSLDVLDLVHIKKSAS